MGIVKFLPVLCDKPFFRPIYKWNGTEPTENKPFHSLYTITVGGMQISYLLVFNVVWVAMLIITLIKGLRLMYADERERPQAKASIMHQMIGILALGCVVNIVSKILPLLM